MTLYAGAEGLLNTNNSKQVGDFFNEEMSREEDSDISKDISLLVKDDIDPKPEEDSDVAAGNSDMLKVDILPKPTSSCTTQDEYLKSGSVSDLNSNEEQEVSNSEISPHNESENCQHEMEKVVTSISVVGATSLLPSEKLEGDEMDDQLSRKFVLEPAAQPSQPASKIKETPLCHKSLRKLKRMLKEKLQVRLYSLSSCSIRQIYVQGFPVS